MEDDVQSPLVGVLAGMGPAAGAAFYSRLIASTPAARDQDHVRVAMWADPAVPDRAAALVGEGPSPLEGLLAGLRWLRVAGASFVAMPCNTAHAFREELVSRSGMDVLDMVSAAVDLCRREVPGVRTIGVLSTRGTRATRLYERAAVTRGVDVVHVDPEVQAREVDAAIALIKAGKAGEEAAAHLQAAAGCLRTSGAQVVVAACTELSLAAWGAPDALPVVDSVEALIGRVHERLA